MFPGSITTPGGAFTPYPSAWAQFAADPENAQALQGYQQVMAMMQQAGGFMPFAYPGMTPPIMPPPVSTPSTFIPRMVPIHPVNLTGTLNEAAPSNVHEINEAGQEAARRKKGKAIAEPSKTRDSAFKRLGGKEDGPRKSAKLRLDPEMGRTSATERLGGGRHAQSRRSKKSETIHQDEEEAESQPRASAYTRLSYDEDDLDKIGSVAKKLRALEEKVDEKAGAKKHTLAKSPFSARVHAQKLRRKVKLDVEKFTGKEDPNVHLDTFHNAAQMAGCTDAEECLLFFSSLRGRPVEWFNGLPHGRIGSFEKLAEVFRKKYQDNCIKRKKFTYLNTVGQREKETLTQFLTRWRDEVDKVEEMDNKTAMSLLMNAFRSGDLYTEFCRRPPSSYQEAYNTAWEYAEAEVLNKNKRELEEGYTKSKSDKPKKDEQTGGSKLKATYDGSIHQIRDDKKGEQPKRQWTEKWCTYHQSDSHNTADCRNVKAVLKEMALKGELGEGYATVKKMTRQFEQTELVSQQVDKGEEKARIEPDANTEEIVIDASNPERKVKIGTDLREELRTEIVQVLTRYKSLFAWSVADMPGIDRSVICHRLSVLEGSRPVRQKKRFLASDRRDFVKKEVKDLLEVGHIREVNYPEWLANVVLAPKGDTWRMCVDYTDLNKACPMDSYPLPSPDQMVDETAGCELLSFMDAFKGYHQIFMAEDDEEKTAFLTPDGTYCYKVMVNKLFRPLLGRTMEAYVDDMLVKSRASGTHAQDLEKCFEIMTRHNLRLNPKKCVFAETLYLYLGVTQMAVSSVLMRDDGIQRPIYYVSKALNGAESRYTPTEKAGYALFITAKKLTSYFQAHPIVVLTDLPLGTVMRDSTSSGRMIKWAMMLTQFNIEYRPRTVIKGQDVADFLVEMTGHQEEEPARTITEPWWSMSVDGAAGPKGYGGGVVFTTPEGFKVYHALIFNFKLTNNETEYEALIGGLRLAKTLQITCLKIKSDSSLVVGHINGNMEAKGEKMQKYRDLARALLKDLTEYVMEQIPRGENTDVDLLSKLTQAAPEHVSKLTKIETLENASIERLYVSLIEEDGQLNLTLVEPDDIWMDDLVKYYMTGQFPEDEDRVRKVKLRAPRFQMLDGRLYKRAFGGPLLRCLTRAEAERVIAEVHEGVCAAHQMSRTLAQRILLLGYFWPTMNQDCEKYVQRCKTCQVFYKFPGRPATYYHPVSNVIPFARFGMDIIGAFPQAQGRKKYVMVAIDYFTKWETGEEETDLDVFKSRDQDMR
ncbi:unnamed protein product [Cuscuta campestris]|uniref:Uncharacterized protein n=1 Tax=Cuscuta campestris TaxID=132261 RepID=A0A484NGE7_9ASTE|nr:unnamed protein product [Cuscuta campestris]